MIFTAKQIKSMLKKMWPKLDSEDNLIFIRMEECKSFDSEFDLISIVNLCTPRYIDRPPSFECEFNADRLALRAWEFREETTRSVVGPVPDFFGVALGLKFRDRPGNHALNISMVQDRFYFIDPKDKAVWPGRKDTDDPYFVWR